MTTDPASSETTPAVPEVSGAGVDEVDTDALERSQQAIDEGNEAAREVADSDPVDGDLEVPGVGTDADTEQGEVTPTAELNGSDEPGPAVPVDGLRAIFDEDADLYDRARPGYPAELLADLRTFADLGPGSTIIEIGPGTGQATLPLVASGAAVTAVELGPSMAARLRDNVDRAGAVGVAGAGVVDVVVAAFEDWPLPGRRFDAVVAFTAWHWLDRNVRAAKVAAALRPGGVLATVTTLHVDNDQDQFSTDVQACYDRWDPATTPGFRPPSAAEAPPVLDEVDASELFEPGVRRRFVADVVYSAAAYVDVLHTYSNHRALSPEQRQGLFACIRRLITEAYGGRVTKRYLYELRLARRR